MHLPSVLKTSVLLAATAVAACASKPFVPIEATSIVEVQGKTQTDLFDSARRWFSEYFASGESVLDYESRETGTLIGKGIAVIGHDLLHVIEYRVHFTLTVETKDGKFRATTKIIKFSENNGRQTYDVASPSKSRVQLGTTELERIVADIRKHVEQSASSTKDW